MGQLPSRALIVSALSLCTGAFALGACTHTTDRVIEPVGGGDASTTVPETGDASVAPIGPVARSHGAPEQDPPPDFTWLRSPELGSSIRNDVHFAESVSTGDAVPSIGGVSGIGGNGAGGSDRRPVSTGGTSYF